MTSEENVWCNYTHRDARVGREKGTKNNLENSSRRVKERMGVLPMGKGVGN
jgi:hypothetical protein